LVLIVDSWFVLLLESKKEEIAVLSNKNNNNQLYYRQVLKGHLSPNGKPKVGAFRPRPKDQLQLSVDAASMYPPPPSPAQQIYEFHYKLNSVTCGSWSVNQSKTVNLNIIPDKSKSHRGHSFVIFPNNEDEASLLAIRLRDDAICHYSPQKG